jgi:hypothetical protein
VECARALEQVGLKPVASIQPSIEQSAAARTVEVAVRQNVSEIVRDPGSARR